MLIQGYTIFGTSSTMNGGIVNWFTLGLVSRNLGKTVPTMLRVFGTLASTDVVNASATE